MRSPRALRPRFSCAAAGSAITELRESYGFTVQQWADLLGVAASTAYRWEQEGVRQGKAHQGTLDTLDAAAGVPLEARARIPHCPKNPGLRKRLLLRAWLTDNTVI